MRSLSLWFVEAVLVLFLVLSTACTSSLDASKAVSTPSLQATLSGSTKASELSPSIDSIAQQVLVNMHNHGWNAGAMTRGVTTGGLYINWKMDEPSVTNAVRAGADGNPQHNHDPQVDLLYLTALVEYDLLHPQDHSFVGDIQRATGLVLNDFRSYNLPKGWIYFYLLRDGLTLQNADLVNEAHTVVNNFYLHWYDAELGFVYNRNHTPGDYSTDHTIDCGAALIDAGLRWHQLDWVNAGERTLNHTIAVALNPTYHLFYNSMIVGSDGQDKAQNYQAKPSTQGEAVDELLTAFSLTHRQLYLNTATLVLQSLFVSSGLWDTDRGGFFFALDMQKGSLLKGYKETRSQTLVLVGLNHYNQLMSAIKSQQGMARQQYVVQEQQLINVLTDKFYQRHYHGFFYRVTPDFQAFVSAVGQGIGIEDYFTTEAMGSALDGLQQTELVMFTRKSGESK